ncbi:putative amino-acid permease PB24D3.02c [Hypsizygus marmoreus]|uniref:Amino-acid permease PB24D3.02c n=1 Tax=Hypsizygus marmoreus TaxID=39966 RepID=A0A369JCZ2_HYPMA|nr:putative amino-acid permease PB24D3.02c [Hypsizygus marmoreus]
MMLQDGGDETPRATVELKLDHDEALLASLGYKQEFRRVFNPIEVFGVGFSIIGLLPSMASVLVYSIPYGGAAAMVWGWGVCAIFLTVIALAMAELGSAAPTSGGLYYWTFMFSSHKWRCLLSWIVGYSNTVGNIASVASVDWGCAVQIMAAASIGSDLSFTATVGQTFVVYAGLLICHAIICSLNPKVIARLQTPFIVVNVVLCLVVIIGVPAATPKVFKNKASYAFGDFQNFSGWPNGYAFILSFLAPLWAIGAFDSTVHISEEATNADVAIPYAIILAATSSGILGWAINVALTFCMGTDLEGILDSPIGQPMATILFNSFGQRGTLAFWAWIIIIQFTMGMSMLTTCSRQIFAFSRDGGLPLSRWLYNVNDYTHAPVNCVWFAAFASLLLGLLAFAGANAIGAIFSLVVTGQYLAYSIPISARFIGNKEIKRGPFSLGKFSLPVAVIAVIWMAFIIVVFLFPAAPHPDSSNMNYTVVVLGGTLVLAVAYFYLPVYGGVHWFKGPVQTIGNLTISSEETRQSDTKDEDDSGS